MLSVGREINIRTKETVCRACEWEGEGISLSAGLVRIADSSIYLYAYRCPACGSFDVARKGKLLEFRLPHRIAETKDGEATANRVSREA